MKAGWVLIGNVLWCYVAFCVIFSYLLDTGNWKVNTDYIVSSC